MAGPNLALQARPFKVLIAGGSYAGLGTALNLLDLCSGRFPRFAYNVEGEPDARKVAVEITIVDERDGYYHLISSPLVLASSAFAQKAWRRFEDIPALRTIKTIQGSIQTIESKLRKATILDTQSGLPTEITYDFFVGASGLRRAWPVVPQSRTKADYLREALSHITSVESAEKGVVVIGGGAVGIEMAAEIKLIMPTQRVTLIHSRENLLSSEPLPDDFRERSRTALEETGVELIMGQRVLKTLDLTSEDGSPYSELHLDSGARVVAGHVIYAISKGVPSTEYMPEASLDEQRYVQVTPSLNLLPEISNARYHFAVGDIARWSGIKRCGTAMHMGQYAAHNIHQLMLQNLHQEQPSFKELDPIPPMMAIAIGKQAVAYHPSEGTTFGEQVLKSSFGDDLGDSICWNYLQLGKESPEVRPST